MLSIAVLRIPALAGLWRQRPGSAGRSGFAGAGQNLGAAGGAFRRTGALRPIKPLRRGTLAGIAPAFGDVGTVAGSTPAVASGAQNLGSSWVAGLHTIRDSVERAANFRAEVSDPKPILHLGPARHGAHRASQSTRRGSVTTADAAQVKPVQRHVSRCSASRGYARFSTGRTAAAFSLRSADQGHPDGIQLPGPRR